jgi:uncharacterized delta-60 repeat protein
MRQLARRSRVGFLAVVVALMAWGCGPGDLDATFGQLGRVTTDFDSAVAICQGATVPCSAAHGIARQPDGKLVAAGSFRGPRGFDFAVARYDADGSPDPTFGTNGVFTWDLGDTDVANAVTIQRDGKIVVAGSVTFLGDVPRVALLRIDSDGTLDPTFGVGGIVDVPTGVGGANALALQRDGKIVVAGGHQVGFAPINGFAVARYLPSGALDAAFGTGGTAAASFGDAGSEAHAVVIQGSSRIVAAGVGPDPRHGFALVGFTSDGALDPGFGTGGEVVTTFPDAATIAWGMAERSNDSLVVAGSTGGAFALVRYRSGGALDQTFGTGGRVVTTFAAPAAARAVTLGRHGEIVAVGGTDPKSGPAATFLLAGYRAHGTLDRRFGDHGRVTTAFPNGSAGAFAAITQPDGSYVAAGSAGQGFGVARYLGHRVGHRPDRS